MPQTKCPICRFVNDDDQAVCRRCGTPIGEAPQDRKRAAQERPSPAAGQQSLNIRRGQVIAKRYVVQSIVGRGGMGCIYKVHDNTLDEDVALKTLLPEYSRDKMVVERFFNEARIARGLSHPNIVRVHDIGIEGEVVYISMELLQGKSLRSLLEALPPGQRLPVRKVLDIFEGLCAALEYAHQYTIHRDIKPENVMVLPDGTVKLMDFGISKLMGNPNVTSASIVMGTPFYMSPEQVKHSANVDARADVYSVGVMLYEVLSGHAPTGIRKNVADVSGEVPPALDPIIEKCVDPDPNKRYQNARELRQALANISKPTTSTAFERMPPVSPSVGAGGASYLRFAVGAFLLFVVWGAAGLGLWQAEQRRLQHLAQATVVPADSGAPSAGVEASPQDRFLALTELLERGRQRARSELLRLDEESQHAAEPLWEAAEEARMLSEYDAATDIERALDMGWQALYRYMALTVRVDDMIFVPPGTVELDVGNGTRKTFQFAGYFIDARPVTAERFLRFVETHAWQRNLEFPAEAIDAPAVNVSFYDAQAYAASRVPAARVPTEAQWAAALDHAQRRSILSVPESPAPESLAPEAELDADMESEPESEPQAYFAYPRLSEWTRDVADGFGAERLPGQAMQFRTPLITGRMYIDENMNFAYARDGANYESRTQYIAFRCVIELPSTLDEVSAFLQ